MSTLGPGGALLEALVKVRSQRTMRVLKCLEDQTHRLQREHKDRASQDRYVRDLLDNRNLGECFVPEPQSDVQKYGLLEEARRATESAWARINDCSCRVDDVVLPFYIYYQEFETSLKGGRGLSAGAVKAVLAALELYNVEPSVTSWLWHRWSASRTSGGGAPFPVKVFMLVPRAYIDKERTRDSVLESLDRLKEGLDKGNLVLGFDTRSLLSVSVNRAVTRVGNFPGKVIEAGRRRPYGTAAALGAVFAFAIVGYHAIGGYLYLRHPWQTSDEQQLLTEKVITDPKTLPPTGPVDQASPPQPSNSEAVQPAPNADSPIPPATGGQRPASGKAPSSTTPPTSQPSPEPLQPTLPATELPAVPMPGSHAGGEDSGASANPDRVEFVAFTIIGIIQGDHFYVTIDSLSTARTDLVDSVSITAMMGQDMVTVTGFSGTVFMKTNNELHVVVNDESCPLRTDKGGKLLQHSPLKTGWNKVGLAIWNAGEEVARTPLGFGLQIQSP